IARGSRGAAIDRARRHWIAHMVIGNGGGAGDQSCAKQQSVTSAHFLANPSRPKTGRNQTPAKEPTKAAANHSQPCRLPVAIPENKAPILQPKDRRAP